jgi:hypothetical protein
MNINLKEAQSAGAPIRPTFHYILLAKPCADKIWAQKLARVPAISTLCDAYTGAGSGGLSPPAIRGFERVALTTGGAQRALFKPKKDQGPIPTLFCSTRNRVIRVVPSFFASNSSFKKTTEVFNVRNSLRTPCNAGWSLFTNYIGQNLLYPSVT